MALQTERIQRELKKGEQLFISIKCDYKGGSMHVRDLEGREIYVDYIWGDMERVKGEAEQVKEGFQAMGAEVDWDHSF